MLPFQTLLWRQRYQKLLRDRWAAGKDTISRARYARQLGHTGGNREPPSNLPNLHRSVEAPRAKPKATPKVQRTPPPPPPKRRKSDSDASRPSETAPASQASQVEEDLTCTGSGSSSARSRASGCTAGHYAAYGGRGRGCTRSPLPCTS